MAEPGVQYGATNIADVSRFIQMAYDQGWVRSMPLSEWRDTPRGRALIQDPAAMADGTMDELARVLTTYIRSDRFCDGYLAAAFSVLPP